MSIIDTGFVDLPSFNTQSLIKSTNIKSIPFISEVESLVYSSFVNELTGLSYLSDVWVRLPYYVLLFQNQQKTAAVKITVLFDPFASKIEVIGIEQ